MMILRTGVGLGNSWWSSEVCILRRSGGRCLLLRNLTLMMMLSGVRGVMASRASGDAGWPVEWIRNVRNVERTLGSLVIGGGREGKSHCERRGCFVAGAKRFGLRAVWLAICRGLISRSDMSSSWSWRLRSSRALKDRQ